MEEALLLGPYRSLVGIHTHALSGALPGAGKIAVVMLNSGLIHHVGPHRLHVKLARALAARGIGALRVDLSGIGDSSPRPDHLPAAQLGFREPREILDSLVEYGYEQFVLFGICSGARHALQAVAGDLRIRGLVLVNQEAASEDGASTTQAGAQFYLRRSLWNPRAWLNLLTGRVRYKALFTTLANEIRRRLTAGGKQQNLDELLRAELAPALAQDCRLLLVISDRHAQLAELLGDGIRDLQDSGQLRLAVFPQADHLFTALNDQASFIGQVCQWVEVLQRDLSGLR